MPTADRRHRRRRLAVALAVLVGVTAATAVAASRIRSRDQAAADRAPPPRSVLTAEVESRVLTDTLVARAAVTTEATVTVPVPDLPTGSRPTITAAPAALGAELAEGAVAFEVAGRPVLVLLGTIPAYRALAPGAVGADVTQLQAALSRLGSDVTDDPSGTYGRATADAVGGLYESRGSGAIVHQVGDRDEAQAAVAAARSGLVEAETDASGDPTRTAAARRQLDAAEDTLAAIDAGSGPSIPFGEVVFVPTLPVRLGTAPAVGTAATDALGELRAGRLRLEARLGVLEADAVTVAQSATAHDDATGAAIEATVTAIGSTETAADTGQTFRRVILEPTQPIDPTLLGRDLRLTIEGESTDDEVLVVPLAAITNGPDGGPRVERIDAETDDAESIPVQVGQTADGYAEVTAPGGELAEGEAVVIGR